MKKTVNLLAITLKTWKLFFLLFEEQRDRDRWKVFHLLAFSPNAHNSWGWVGLKAVARNFTWVTHHCGWKDPCRTVTCYSPGTHEQKAGTGTWGHSHARQVPQVASYQCAKGLSPPPPHWESPGKFTWRTFPWRYFPSPSQSYLKAQGPTGK